VRHPPPAILAVGLAAVLAGARSFVAIGEWVACQSTHTLTQLGVSGQGRDESTIRRTFSPLEADVLDRVLGGHMWTKTRVVGGRRVIAIDGKTVRGARTKTTTAPHLVAAFDHHAGAVLGQVAIAAKSNEIPAVRDLLSLFDLPRVVITVDAMHTQNDTATAITTAGRDYVFTVKGNQPTLHTACKNLPWADVQAHRMTTTGHRRRVTRTIKVVIAPAWVGFADAVQIAQVRRTVTRAGNKTVEVVHLITSADHHAAPPATLARMGPSPLRHPEQSALGPRRVLRQGQVTSPYGQRTARDGDHAQHRDQPVAPQRVDQHRRRPTTSRPRLSPPTPPAADLVNTTLPGPWRLPRAVFPDYEQ